MLTSALAVSLSLSLTACRADAGVADAPPPTDAGAESRCGVGVTDPSEECDGGGCPAPQTCGIDCTCR